MVATSRAARGRKTLKTSKRQSREITRTRGGLKVEIAIRAIMVKGAELWGDARTEIVKVVTKRTISKQISNKRDNSSSRIALSSRLNPSPKQIPMFLNQHLQVYQMLVLWSFHPRLNFAPYKSRLNLQNWEKPLVLILKRSSPFPMIK